MNQDTSDVNLADLPVKEALSALGQLFLHHMQAPILLAVRVGDRITFLKTAPKDEEAVLLLLIASGYPESLLPDLLKALAENRHKRTTEP